jgi:hypothetical protein
MSSHLRIRSLAELVRPAVHAFTAFIAPDTKPEVRSGSLKAIHFAREGVYHSSMRAARAGTVVLALGVSAIALPTRGWSSAVALRAQGSVEPVRVQPPAPAGPTIPATVALVENWPDGRITYELTSPRRASMWTPMFPRVEGYRLPEGAKPVYAVQFARVLVGRDIKVDVSVLLGSAQPPGVPVASVVVSAGSHIVIGELAKFGVQPVTLSMLEAAR